MTPSARPARSRLAVGLSATALLLGGGSALYGVLLGCVGAGAVGRALLLPRLRARIEINRLVPFGGLATAPRFDFGRDRPAEPPESL